ncbi:hypothetical protein [Terrisporobacter mayombei]|uniref:Uncharacterized protein n=1 Tax=Terrisporobacter mayombei TaxID=1541 RepID=A0ABY9PVT3_9FIRM|nr:hypothetical protein [Terrisporobacter mayombei]MCC3869885.1 hypothetical protein [Terrisporobacter mayombei]WMT79776.1 hypothetical protein TEMA_00430 [Terrisporobacter mayombei]
MCRITDFYQYKYCRGNYFINVFINKESAKGIKSLLIEKLKEKNLNEEYICVYTILLDKININMKESIYVKLRINKCYLQYLKDLYYDFYGREESIYVKEVICHLQYFIEEDGDSIFKFYDLMENTKISALSKM